MAPIIVHHLQVSQSERIPWLCEELGVPYDLRLTKRAPLFAPPEYKALHPSGGAPVIEDGNIKLAESGACVEYISRRHGGGKLFLQPEDPAYPDFIYWWHWSNGSFQPAVSRLMTFRASKMSDDLPIVANFKERFRRTLGQLNDRLRDNEWLAGSQFSVADIMVVFSLSTMRFFSPYSLADYEHIVKYLQRVGQREAYQRALKKSDPDMELQLSAEPPTPWI